jgi:hypothetical protein
MDDEIIVRYVKIDGQVIDNPLPRFEYEVKVGTWVVCVESEKYADFLSARDGQVVEVEVGLHFGVLRDVGVVKTWRSTLPDAPAFVAKIGGSNPMRFVER